MNRTLLESKVPDISPNDDEEEGHEPLPRWRIDALRLPKEMPLNIDTSRAAAQKYTPRVEDQQKQVAHLRLQTGVTARVGLPTLSKLLETADRLEESDR
jgi:hypothetical protein